MPQQGPQTPPAAPTPVTAATPAAPQVVQVVPSPGGGVQIIRSGSPSATYEAYRNQRSELRNQLERLEEQRDNIASELRQPSTADVDKKGLEQRITSIVQRIIDTEKQ